MPELYYKMMREADASLCWRYLDAPATRSFLSRHKRWVCTLGRAHDAGVHEIASGSDG